MIIVPYITVAMSGENKMACLHFDHMTVGEASGPAR